MCKIRAEKWFWSILYSFHVISMGCAPFSMLIASRCINCCPLLGTFCPFFISPIRKHSKSHGDELWDPISVPAQDRTPPPPKIPKILKFSTFFRGCQIGHGGCFLSILNHYNVLSMGRAPFSAPDAIFPTFRTPEAPKLRKICLPLLASKIWALKFRKFETFQVFFGTAKFVPGNGFGLSCTVFTSLAWVAPPCLAPVPSFRTKLDNMDLSQYLKTYSPKMSIGLPRPKAFL